MYLLDVQNTAVVNISSLNGRWATHYSFGLCSCSEGEATAAKLQAEIAQLQQRLKDQEKAYEEALDEMEMEQVSIPE